MKIDNSLDKDFERDAQKAWDILGNTKGRELSQSEIIKLGGYIYHLEVYFRNSRADLWSCQQDLKYQIKSIPFLERFRYLFGKAR